MSGPLSPVRSAPTAGSARAPQPRKAGEVGAISTKLGALSQKLAEGEMYQAQAAKAHAEMLDARAKKQDAGFKKEEACTKKEEARVNKEQSRAMKDEVTIRMEAREDLIVKTLTEKWKKEGKLPDNEMKIYLEYKAKVASRAAR